MQSESQQPQPPLSGAEFTREAASRSAFFSSRTKRVLILIQNVSFSYDTRMQNVAATLERAGYDLLVISPRYAGDPLRSRDGRVERWHYPFPSLLDGAGGHVLEYLYSFAAIGTYSLVGLVVRNFKIVHICSPPDILFPLAALYRLLGRKVVVDVHDLSPELATVRYGLAHRSPIVRFLRFAERIMLRLANRTITTTETQRDVLAVRSNTARERISVVFNGLDSSRGVPNSLRPGDEGGHEPQMVGYLGTMNTQDGVDILLRAIHHVHHVMDRRKARFLLIGDGGAYESLVKLASRLRVDDVTTFTGRLMPREAMSRLNSCAVCVQPDPKNQFTDTCRMVKALEYMSLGKPVVAFDLSETRKCCGQAAVYAHGNSHVDLAEKIVALIDAPDAARRIGVKARKRFERLCIWGSSERQLLKVYEEELA